MERMPVSRPACKPSAKYICRRRPKSALSASQEIGRAEDGPHHELVLGVQGKGLLICEASCFWGCYGGDPACASACRPLTNKAPCISISNLWRAHS